MKYPSFKAALKLPTSSICSLSEAREKRTDEEEEMKRRQETWKKKKARENMNGEK